MRKKVGRKREGHIVHGFIEVPQEKILESEIPEIQAMGVEIKKIKRKIINADREDAIQTYRIIPPENWKIVCEGEDFRFLDEKEKARIKCLSILNKEMEIITRYKALNGIIISIAEKEMEDNKYYFFVTYQAYILGEFSLLKRTTPQRYRECARAALVALQIYYPEYREQLKLYLDENLSN